MKRGQITLFVILGIIIVSVIGFAVYYHSVIMESSPEENLAARATLTPEEKKIALDVDDCVTKTLANGILEVSRDGGYYPPKPDSVLYMAYSAPLYYDNGKEALPAIGDAAAGLSAYVDENLWWCLDSSLEITKQPKAKIIISDSVKARVDMEIRHKESKISGFYGDLNLDYGSMLDSAFNFYRYMLKFNESIDLLDSGRMASIKGYKYSFDSVEGKSVYALNFNQKINDMDLAFAFAIDNKDDILGNAASYSLPADDKTEDRAVADEVPEDMIEFTDTEMAAYFRNAEPRQEGFLNGI